MWNSKKMKEIKNLMIYAKVYYLCLQKRMKIKKRRRQKRERKKEDESIKQNNGRSDSMDIDKDNENNYIFNFDFRTISKNLEDGKKFEYNHEINSSNNNYKNGFNVDEFFIQKIRSLL